MTSTADPADAALAAQYEAYPYPARDPADEAKRLIIGSPSHLLEVDHWVFAARRPSSRPLRALFAGGGSGDGAIMLAQQMAWAGRSGEVVWLDRSAAARRVAEARAQARRLGNIRFVSASLLDAPRLGLGAFDYIDCCGVLHHLPDPAAGLAALRAVLAPGGGIGLMVYAPHGRTGVYMLQDALRLLAPPDRPPPERLEIARRLWRHLPETAWLKKNPWITDHLTGGDAGLYDLLLNPRDRAFTVPALLDLLAGAGLRPITFLEPVRYDAARYLPDPRLRERIAALGWAERAALAEAMTGNMGIHILYAARAEDPALAADWSDPAAVPVLREVTAEQMARAAAAGALRVSFDGITLSLPLPRLAPAVLRRVDGRRSLGEIVQHLVAEGAPAERAVAEVQETCRVLEATNRLLLAAPRG
jgi:SAM-dependent methyltransferase